MTTAGRLRGRPAPAVAAVAVSLALVAGNGLAYAFTVLAARTLTPASYGELAALLGVVLVGVVPAGGLQTAGALALARGGSGVTASRLHTAGLIAGAGIGGAALLAAPLVSALLHLPDPAAAVWLAALLVPHTIAGGHQGILQGTGRFGRLAAVIVVFTVAKTVGGIAGLLAGGTPTATLAGMTAGAAAGAVVAWVVCGAPRPTSGGWAMVRAGVLTAAALLGFVLLSGLDLILARHWLPAATAGEYAVGAIIMKVVFWLPQGVGVILLPRLAHPENRRRALLVAVGIVGGLGAVLTIGTAALGARALTLVGGSAYGGGIGDAAWVFAALGTLLAVAQLLLYSGIAAADRVARASVWVAVVAECAVVAALAMSGRGTVLAIACTATTVAALLVGVGLLRHRSVDGTGTR